MDSHPPSCSMWKFDLGSGRESVPVQWGQEMHIRHIESAKVLKLEKAAAANGEFTISATLVDATSLPEGEGMFQLQPHYEQDQEEACFENNFWIYSAFHGVYLHVGTLAALGGTKAKVRYPPAHARDYASALQYRGATPKPSEGSRSYRSTSHCRSTPSSRSGTRRARR